MAVNLNRKATSLGTGQTWLNFGSTKKPEVIHIESVAELRALEFEASVFFIDDKNKKQRAVMGVQTSIEVVEEVKEQLPIEKIKLMNVKSAKISSQQSQGQRGTSQMYTLEELRYILSMIRLKAGTNARLIERLKNLCQPRGNQIQLNLKESSRRSQRDKKSYESMNQPANRAIIVCLKDRAMYIPALSAIDISSCLENYLNIDVPNKAKLKVVDEYAYKIYPFSYLIKNEQYQNEFANEYIILKKAQKRNCKNLIKLDGFILGYGFIALKLKKFEMTLRDYLYHNRYLDDLNEILSEMTKGVKELLELGYIHRDLKTENVMLNLCPLEIVVIEFNRAIRQEIVTLAKVIGTPGYFPTREKCTNGYVHWDVWAIAAIILEYDMEIMAQFGTKHEKQSISLAEKHLKQNEICQGIKKFEGKQIVRAPAYPRQSLDNMLEPLQTARFMRYNKDKQIKIV